MRDHHKSRLSCTGPRDWYQHHLAQDACHLIDALTEAPFLANKSSLQTQHRFDASMKSQQLQSTHQALPRALVPPVLRESAINRAACFLTGKRFRKTTCWRAHHTRGYRTNYSARPFPLMSFPPTPSSSPTSLENGSSQDSIDNLAPSENEAGAFHQICRRDRSLSNITQLSLVRNAFSMCPQNRK